MWFPPVFDSITISDAPSPVTSRSENPRDERTSGESHSSSNRPARVLP